MMISSITRRKTIWNRRRRRPLQLQEAIKKVLLAGLLLEVNLLVVDEVVCLATVSLVLVIKEGEWITLKPRTPKQLHKKSVASLSLEKLNGKTLLLIPVKMCATKILIDERKEGVATSQKANRISGEKNPRSSRIRNPLMILMISELRMKLTQLNNRTGTGEVEILVEASARMTRKLAKEDHHLPPMIVKVTVAPLQVTVIQSNLRMKEDKASCLQDWPSKRNRTGCQAKPLPKRPGEWDLLQMFLAALLIVPI